MFCCVYLSSIMICTYISSATFFLRFFWDFLLLDWYYWFWISDNMTNQNDEFSFFWNIHQHFCFLVTYSINFDILPPLLYHPFEKTIVIEISLFHKSMREKRWPQNLLTPKQSERTLVLSSAGLKIKPDQGRLDVSSRKITRTSTP